MTKYEYNVVMTCDGCKKAVNAVVSKVPGVENLNIDMAKQTLTVEGPVSQEDIEAALKKTGKKYTFQAAN